MPAVLQNYQPVTAERLLHPENSNWLTIRRTYDGWGYSRSRRSRRPIVGRLRPVWVVLDRPNPESTSLRPS